MQKIPNFFIVGAPKSGTTALAYYLKLHDQVFFSSPKEAFFWDHDHACSRETHQLWTLDDYLQLFEGYDSQVHLVAGEGTTTYLQSEVAIKQIVDFNPNAKFIAMLRNPIEASYAMHGEMRRHYREDEPDFETAWRLMQPRANGQSLPKNKGRLYQLQYRDVMTYAPQLKRFFGLVRQENRLVLLYDDFKQDVRSCYQQVLKFLDLPDDGRTEFPRVNQSRRYRYDWLGKLYHSPPAILRTPMLRLRSKVMARSGSLKQITQNLLSQKQSRPELSQAFVEELKCSFQEDIKETSELLSRDLSNWLDDRS